jgi:hypothetical protein
MNERTEFPDRMWTAITALAASWTTPDATPADYAQALGRAFFIYNGARELTAHEFEVMVGGVHVMSLVPGENFGIAFTDP